MRTNQAGNPFLTNVVAVRGGSEALVALKRDGTVWTWGASTRLGNGTAESSRTFATQMTLPTLSGEAPKMIGTTSSNGTPTYYLLSTAGNLYALGDNNALQLGNFATALSSATWQQCQKSATAADYLTNVAWISPQEHDYSSGAINVLTVDGTLYAWGNNQFSNMLGGTGSFINPIAMPGGLTSADQLLAIETGGHTSIVVKQCNGNYGDVGHRVNGSMGDGSSVDAYEPTYNFSETARLNLCGAISGVATLFPVPGAVTVGQTVQLNYTPIGGSFTVSGPATVSSKGELIATGTGTVNVTYTVYGACGTTQSDITINVNSSLSVNFGNIQAQLTGNTLMVNWTTLQEKNNSYFEIEASTDGKNFTKIGEVKSQAENGNSSVSLHYNFKQAVANNALQLGGGLIILSALLMGFKRRKLLGVMAIAAGVSLFMAGCTKNDGVEKNDAKVMVRIVQVHKDGTRSYSKAIKATE